MNAWMCRTLLCLLAMMAGTLALDDEGGYADMFGPKTCTPFYCKKGQEAAPKRPLKLTSTGSCNGLSGGGMTMFGGGGEKEEALTPCCDARAACVQICGMSVKSCDDAFDVCMDSTCASLAEPEAEECEKNKKMHKLMLNLGGGGCDKYTAGQSGSCQCMEPAKAATRREQVLTDLYKKHSPENIAKVKGLAAKADTPKKFATLVTKLVAKFPKMIKLVKDPQMAYFEDMMRDSKSGKDFEKKAPKTVVDEPEDDDADIVDLDAASEL